GRTDPFSPFADGPDIVPTKDGKWVMFAEPYPALRQHTLELLRPRGGTYQALADAVKEGQGGELQTAGEEGGRPEPAPPKNKRRVKNGCFSKNPGPDPSSQRRKSGQKGSNPLSPQPD